MDKLGFRRQLPAIGKYPGGIRGPLPTLYPTPDGGEARLITLLQFNQRSHVFAKG